MVGMSGALGGFVLPIWFGALNDLTNLWTSCFMLLFGLVGMALIWMHIASIIMDRRPIPAVRAQKDLPEHHGLRVTQTDTAQRPLASRVLCPGRAFAGVSLDVKGTCSSRS